MRLMPIIVCYSRRSNKLTCPTGWFFCNCRLLAGIGLFFITTSAAIAEPVLFIGTGGSAGTYFPIGSLIAEAISDWAGHQRNSDYRIEGLNAIAQRSSGSASNVDDINAGLVEAALAQANIVHWSYTGTGPYEGTPAFKSLRTIGTLYFESLHLISRVGSGIDSIGDLAGHTVSVDEIGSGTQLDVASVFSLLELKSSDLNIVYLKANDAMDRLRRDEVDAFFIVAGYPVSGVAELIDEGLAKIVPIVGSVADALMDRYPYFSVDYIPANTYANSDAIKTLAMPAQLIVSEHLDEELVYRISAMLWSDETAGVLAAGHPKGKEISMAAALVNIGAPLHEGAARYYRERINAVPPIDEN